jgi:heme-degrading monooxygenase HmoA
VSEHVRVWRFRVRPGCERDFEDTYGADGAWVQLFRAAAGFVGTELLRADDEPRTYLTIDRWISADAYQRFRAECAVDYAALDARCEAWTESETALGTWAAPG